MVGRIKSNFLQCKFLTGSLRNIVITLYGILTEIVSNYLRNTHAILSAVSKNNNTYVY